MYEITIIGMYAVLLHSVFLYFFFWFIIFLVLDGIIKVCCILS